MYSSLCQYIFFIFFTEALKAYGNKLTEFERAEIEKYPEIWYLGLDACKIHGEQGGSQNGGYDDDNGSYNKVNNYTYMYIKYNTAELFKLSFKNENNYSY